MILKISSKSSSVPFRIMGFSDAIGTPVQRFSCGGFFSIACNKSIVASFQVPEPYHHEDVHNGHNNVNSGYSDRRRHAGKFESKIYWEDWSRRIKEIRSGKSRFAWIKYDESDALKPRHGCEYRH